MNSKQRIGLAIGGGVIALAAAAGVGAVAANLAAAGDGQPGGSNPAGYGRDGGFGRGGQQFDTTALAQQLASKLGVDEAKMKTALDNAIAAARPTGRPSGTFTPGSMPSGSMPSGVRPRGGFGGNGERLAAMATSIASELNLDQAKVLAALQEVMAGMRGGQGPGGPGSQPTK